MPKWGLLGCVALLCTLAACSLSGDEAYLVVRYEYAPGFEELDAVAVGGQGHYWIGDRFKLGLTTNSNDEGDTDSGAGSGTGGEGEAGDDRGDHARGHIGGRTAYPQVGDAGTSGPQADWPAPHPVA